MAYETQSANGSVVGVDMVMARMLGERMGFQLDMELFPEGHDTAFKQVKFQSQHL